MYKNKKIAVIAPVYNEETKIKLVIERIHAMPIRIVDEIIVVDDGSTDSSAQVARMLGATVLSLPTVEGVGAALRMGYSYAKNKHYDILVTMAGNNKDEPKEISALLDPITTHDFDFVQGSRYLSTDGTNQTKKFFGDMPLYRRFATRLHPLFFSLFTGKKVTESTNGFRAFKSDLLNDNRIKLDQPWLDEYELEPYLYYKAVTLGYKTTEVACTKTYPPKAIAKKTGYTKMKPFIGWWSILRPLFLLKLRLRS